MVLLVSGSYGADGDDDSKDGPDEVDDDIDCAENFAWQTAPFLLLGIAITTIQLLQQQKLHKIIRRFKTNIAYGP